jgi:pimeloyl-ACP methyl ester carboxylesterase
MPTTAPETRLQQWIIESLKLIANKSTHVLGLALLAAPCYAQGGPVVTTEADHPARNETIRSFKVHIPEDALVDLRRRIAATRWPDKETVADHSQGVPLATMQELVRYWVTDYYWRKAGVSASRLYWEYKGGFFNAKGVSIPVAVTVFPGEQYQAPLSWTELAYPKLIHYNRVDKGGHFAAWEQPQLFAAEVRTAFKSLRGSSKAVRSGTSTGTALRTMAR